VIDQEHWVWLTRYEKLHHANPHVQEAKKIANQAGQAQHASDYKKAATLFAQAADIAAKGNLLELELIYTLLSNNLYVEDENQLLGQAVGLVVKAQRLDNDNFPWYPMFQYNLASVYGSVDPLSYLDEINEIFDLLESGISYRKDIICRIQMTRSQRALQIRDFEMAHHYASLALEVNPDDAYYHSAACYTKARVYFRQKKFESALDYLEQQEIHARKTKILPNNEAEALFDQGICLIHLKHLDEAEERFKKSDAIATVHQVNRHEWTIYARHIAEQEYDKVLSEVNKLLENESRFPLRRLGYLMSKVIVLKLMEQDISETLDETREAAKVFKKPEKYNIWIDAIADGDTHYYNWHKVDTT